MPTRRRPGLAAALVEVYDLQPRRRLEPVATLSAEEFRVEVVAAAKRSIAGDYINAGYFGSYSEAGERFALPAGHLAGIYTATRSLDAALCRGARPFCGGPLDL